MNTEILGFGGIYKMTYLSLDWLTEYYDVTFVLVYIGPQFCNYFSLRCFLCTFIWDITELTVTFRKKVHEISFIIYWDFPLIRFYVSIL